MARESGIDEEKEREKEKGRWLDLSVLPEECVAAVVSLTSPVDAGRLALVSSMLKSAAESDAVWERFLPHDYKAVLPPSVCTASKSKKELYLRLCDRPVLIDEGRKSFSVEKWSGKKWYMLSARDLVIIWGDTPRYWRWVSVAESRFSEVAELVNVCWLEIRGRISTTLLSPITHYTAYLVFKTTSTAYGLDFLPAEVVVSLNGTQAKKKTVYLDSPTERRRRAQIVPRRFSRISQVASQAPPGTGTGAIIPKVRADGWLEIELGEFFNDGTNHGELEMTVSEVRGGNWKSGLIIQGIDIRPPSPSPTR